MVSQLRMGVGKQLRFAQNQLRISPTVTQRTGLVFPAPTGLALDGTAFLWQDISLPHTPATYIFRVNYSSHNYYYTNFFYSNGYNADFVSDQGYYGCHPYPSPPSTGARKWEVSAAFSDTLAATGPTYGQWYTQGVVVGGTTSRPAIDYYYDLDNNTNKVSFTYDVNWVQGAHPCLIFGDNPWTNTDSEAMDGTLRGLQIYSTNLSLANLQTNAANQDTNAAVVGGANLWYINQNPTPTDISDKSGNGHHPAWLNAKRPTLYTE